MILLWKKKNVKCADKHTGTNSQSANQVFVVGRERRVNFDHIRKYKEKIETGVKR